MRQSVEDTLNALLNAEADAICQASKYQRSPDRQDTRAGSYKRKLLTKAGEVELRVPRLQTLPFETQINVRKITDATEHGNYLFSPKATRSVFRKRAKLPDNLLPNCRKSLKKCQSHGIVSEISCQT